MDLALIPGVAAMNCLRITPFSSTAATLDGNVAAVGENGGITVEDVEATLGINAQPTGGEGVKMVVPMGFKFDADPRETSMAVSSRVPKRTKRAGTPPKSKSSVREALSSGGTGPFWNRRRSSHPGPEISLLSEQSHEDLVAVDVKQTEDEPDYYGSTRSRRSRHEAELAHRPKRGPRSKSRGRAVSDALLDVITMCGP
ncbi:unnamed protein product [Notodromas monacha]|uniref:Uncharacterized protein n=1 Tax=Notodromas monacha TaxID=399045 RepID=A0A7R9BIM9_9CRUS|nr:unnamed protein product [Notodromas monacha]CAG0916219.1 unnamed protein product [Notodromas monacha]